MEILVILLKLSLLALYLSLGFLFGISCIAGRVYLTLYCEWWRKDLKGCSFAAKKSNANGIFKDIGFDLLFTPFGWPLVLLATIPMLACMYYDFYYKDAISNAIVDFIAALFGDPK